MIMVDLVLVFAMHAEELATVLVMCVCPRFFSSTLLACLAQSASPVTPNSPRYYHWYYPPAMRILILLYLGQLSTLEEYAYQQEIPDYAYQYTLDKGSQLTSLALE